MVSLIAGLCLTAVVLLTFALSLGAPEDLSWVSGGAFLLYMALTWPRMKRTPRVLICAAVALVVTGLLINRLEISALRDALANSAFLAALFTCFGTLRDAASSSELVRKCGRFLASRGPGKRYGALTVGSHIFGVILNFGAVPLLGTLVLEGTRDADHPDRVGQARATQAAVRRSRMAQAIHRGFITTTAWCPLTISMAVIFAALPEIKWTATVPWLFSLSMAYMGIGWALDRFSKVRRTTAPAIPLDEPADGSWWLLLAILGLVLATFAAGVGVEELLDVRLVVGVMMVSPFVAAGWILVQAFPARGLDGAIKTLGSRSWEHLRVALPAFNMELAFVGSASLIALVIGAMLPPEWIPAALAWLDWPAWVVIALIPWLAVLMGHLGGSPLLCVALIASAMPAPEVMGIAPEMAAVAYAGAWVLVSATSPYTAALVIASRIASSETTPISVTRFGLIGNAVYSLLCLLLLDTVIAAMAWSAAI